MSAQEKRAARLLLALPPPRKVRSVVALALELAAIVAALREFAEPLTVKRGRGGRRKRARRAQALRQPRSAKRRAREYFQRMRRWARLYGRKELFFPEEAGCRRLNPPCTGCGDVFGYPPAQDPHGDKPCGYCVLCCDRGRCEPDDEGGPDENA